MGKILDAEVYKITATDFCPLQEETKEEERVTALKKILNSGMFYFSWPNAGSNFDLTVRAQKQGDNHYESGNSFFWLVLHVCTKVFCQLHPYVSGHTPSERNEQVYSRCATFHFIAMSLYRACGLTEFKKVASI